MHFLVEDEHMLQPNQKNRSQEPKPPFPYFVEEVSCGNSEISLPGTLTLPKTTGYFGSAFQVDRIPQNNCRRIDQ